jgi:hypothetical protein
LIVLQLAFTIWRLCRIIARFDSLRPEPGEVDERRIGAWPAIPQEHQRTRRFVWQAVEQVSDEEHVAMNFARFVAPDR